MLSRLPFVIAGAGTAPIVIGDPKTTVPTFVAVAEVLLNSFASPYARFPARRSSCCTPSNPVFRNGSISHLFEIGQT